VHELAWLLSVVTPMGLLERATSYKDKVAQGAETNHALFAYPVLMAADILLYNSDLVPVGKDQKQHLEIARDIAGKFNDRFGPVFKVPEPVIREATAVVPGVDGRKMSKSYGNTLELFGEDKALEKRIMGIPTDSTPVADPKPVANSVLAQLMQTVGTPAQYESYVGKMKAGGVGYGDLKKELAAVTRELLAPFKEKFKRFAERPDEVEAVLRDGAARARALASPIIEKARQATGLSR
jgi:tryptophanyl-tRNA synthetase